ncbi:MAG: AraC family transcriptional regulator [Clostridia bacterium]|nr:AraC family transcriptional regulator [Clostridia bacterium]
MFSASRQLHISKIYSILFFLAPQDKVYSFDVPTYELIYFIRGTCRITFKGHTFTAKKGDLLYLPKCDDDQKYTMEAIEEFALYYISFDTSDDVPDNYSIIHMESDDIKRTYEHFYREWFAKRECYYYKTMQDLYKILEIAAKQNSQNLDNNRFIQLAASDDYMAEHYCDLDFNYTELREWSGLSYSYFKKLFIEKYGVPPVKYVTRLKINRACELLQTKMFSISKIAELCGFENVYYFSNVFKKYTGISPKNYKPRQ